AKQGSAFCFAAASCAASICANAEAAKHIVKARVRANAGPRVGNRMSMGRENETKKRPPRERSGRDLGVGKDQGSANTNTLFPRLASIWLLPPAATATYCFPPTMYETAGAFTPAPQLYFQSSLPFIAS